MKQSALTPSEITACLLSRAGELQREVDAASASAAPTPGEVIDQKDEAGFAAMSAVREEEINRDLRELREIDAALKRLADGSYGNCIRCGEPIAQERLRARPSAANCLRCQARQEQRDSTLD